ncbi:hypothetical protein BZ13_1201 [Francisella philomiragia subsp. philomiragia ATCC 25015]|nr:hypothetical protein BZ13_1201 [Francisella philomiragia subsp. philomiragia ATCC 25015]EET20601.1 predicted protein [Francisella philomiragia subsp. philomiragia ATCC 25015]
MTALFIILGILFLIFLPIINIYIPLGNFPRIPDSINENYDLNPNKRKVGESDEEYRKRLRELNPNPKPLFTIKSFCITFITVLLLLILFFIFLFF